MCCVIGYTGHDMSADKFKEYLMRTVSRGPDDQRVVEGPFGLMGFGRLAIMGLTPEGMQPFYRGADCVVCNGELYGFRFEKEILKRRGYKFTSDCDCEILLPLYYEYGLDMFRHMDAEFALILYDSRKDRLIAARDPIGIRPLFYGYSKSSHKIAFASEMQNLIGWCDDIRPFPIGSYYCDGRFVRYEDIADVPAPMQDDMDTILTNIREKLIAGVEKRLDADAPVGFLLSGGLDSSLVCSIVAKKRGLKVAHVIAGTRSFDMNMPREVNRTIVDAISDYLFTAGMVANRNLNQEGMIPEYIHYVGNILIDTIRFNRHRLVQPMWFSSLGLRKGNYLLLTLNRRDLLEKKAVLHSLLQTVIEKAGGMPIVAPLHPYVQKAVKSLEVNAPNLHILPPQSYLHFGFLINQARGIVTDSGNIAEEATFLDVPCITLNTYAEHPETWRVGTNVLVNEDSVALANALERLMLGEWKHTTLPDRWDGRTAERIVQTLINGELKEHY